MASEAQVACQQEQAEKRYVMEEKSVGEGTYGAVYRARCSQTGRTVAIKKMKPEHEDEGVPSTAIREVAVLKGADHVNIVKLLDVYCVRRKVHLVFEFIDKNLKEHMRAHSLQLTPSAVRCFQAQILRGILFLHTHRILHRDLKPQNVLIDSSLPAESLRNLKLADFGMARAFSVPIPKYTHEVVTIWYRAPEILFGTQEYALPVDMGAQVASWLRWQLVLRSSAEIARSIQFSGYSASSELQARRTGQGFLLFLTTKCHSQNGKRHHGLRSEIWLLSLGHTVLQCWMICSGMIRAGVCLHARR
jgi:serine/threonine protein kinase